MTPSPLMGAGLRGRSLGYGFLDEALGVRRLLYHAGGEWSDAGH